VIVLDASAVLEVLLRTPAGRRVEDRIFAPAETLHAPHLLDVEVAHVLRRYVLRRELAPAQATERLELFTQFPIRRYAHEPLLARMWTLRANLTAYDAAYVALAEGLRATLVTRDERIADAKGHTARIELL
jgi:predicted nucleic acid-binding protein